MAKTNIPSGTKAIRTPYAQLSFIKKVGFDIRRNPVLYLMFLPVLAYYVLFHYKPMYGIIIAFMNYIPGLPIMESPWVGFDNFTRFFNDPSFERVVFNTINISLTSILFAFPAPIILAILLNELKSRIFSRTVQTISYMPHFVSLVVICGMVHTFTRDNGFITQFLVAIGVMDEPVTMLLYSEYFVPTYIISGIWQEVGYGSIIYLAALTGVSQDLYEAARIDGANKWQQTWNVTLPGIIPTIMTMLVIRLGNVMNVGFEKIMLLYNPQTYDVADVISTFAYRVGLIQAQFSFSTAITLFNSVINLIILGLANTLSRKLTETALW